ncbi:hypothetical protein Droror1_Dr00025310 [Drosera rotundifolia]
MAAQDGDGKGVGLRCFGFAFVRLGCKGAAGSPCENLRPVAGLSCASCSPVGLVASRRWCPSLLLLKPASGRWLMNGGGTRLDESRTTADEQLRRLDA